MNEKARSISVKPGQSRQLFILVIFCPYFIIRPLFFFFLNGHLFCGGYFISISDLKIAESMCILQRNLLFVITASLPWRIGWGFFSPSHYRLTCERRGSRCENSECGGLAMGWRHHIPLLFLTGAFCRSWGSDFMQHLHL